MGVNQTLPATHAFSPGADLWILGQPESSKWALKIDWELNFQLLRASRHKKPQLSPELQEVLEKTGLPLAQTQFDLGGQPHASHEALAPLLVPAELNLPCRWILCFNKWQASTMVKTWRELGSPSTRVFLPKSEELNAFIKQWESSGGDNLQLVLES